MIELGLEPDASYPPIDDVVHENDDGGTVFIVILVALVIL